MMINECKTKKILVHKHMLLSALMNCVYCFTLMLGGEYVCCCVLWQAEAESSTLLSRTVQDKGPLPPVWG